MTQDMHSAIIKFTQFAIEPDLEIFAHLDGLRFAILSSGNAVSNQVVASSSAFGAIAIHFG
jgi:hypothetical protein